MFNDQFLSYFLMFVLAAVGAFLILIVLLQRGRGGGLAGAFGGAGGASALGTKAGDVFTKVTIGVAVIWILIAGMSSWVLQAQTERYPGGDAAAVGGGGIDDAALEPLLDGDDEPLTDEEAGGLLDPDLFKTPTPDATPAPAAAADTPAPAADGGLAAPGLPAPADTPAEIDADTGSGVDAEPAGTPEPVASGESD